MPNSKNRKFFLRSRNPKHTSPFSVLSFSVRSFQTLGIFLQFHRTFSKFHRTFSKFQGKKLEKRPTKMHKQHVTFSKRHIVSSKTSTSFEKTTHNPAKTFENCNFQSRWKSHNSQQLFLSSKYRVKWRGTKRKLLLKTNSLSASLFIPNRALVLKRISSDCWAVCFSFAFGVAGYVENKRETRCSQEIERWQEINFPVTSRTITFKEEGRSRRI